MDCISSFTNNHLRILCIISAILPSFLTVLSQNCSCSDPQQLPSPAPSPQPSLTFVDLRLAVVYPVIQRFKLTITSDPLGITSQWVGPDICSYQGFYCDHPPDNLSAIALAAVDFNEFHLGAPTLVGFIDQLPDLAFFHANSNNFSGIIPPKITQLPYLYELDISNNNFSGRFPTEVFGIKELSFLDIRFNSFSGSVPLQIFNQALDVLYINNNNFMQNLPNNLGSSPVLYLTLANNKFTGPIPRSIGNTSSRLTEVLFLNNYLTGCIPYEIGFLKKAVVFDAGNNLLTGPIPSSLGCLESIEQLNFAGNQLYGQVPEVLCAVGSLLNLSLSDNYFTMIGPMCQNLVKSGVLDVRKNCIHGVPEQRPWKECYYFFFHLKHDCPNHNWLYNYVPCKVHQPPPPPPPSPSCQQSRKPPWGSGSVTYPTLFRHRL